MLPRILFTLLSMAGAVGCGGASRSASAPTATGSGTETFTGATQITESGVCTGARHAFETGEGVVGITLVQSSGGVSLAAQLCDPVADNHEVDCTIPPFARIDVGQTVTATLKGGRFQTLTLYPGGCGTPASTPTALLAYTVTVVHPR